jgi:SRSO17 transposase
VQTRKSIEPMAARLDPAHVQAKHQSLHHVVAQAEIGVANSAYRSANFVLKMR